MEIYLIRHTAVDVPPGVCYGQTDVALRSGWRKDVAAVKAKLPRRPAASTRAFSSPLRRCTVLAEELAAAAHTDRRLREMSFGRWELTPWDQVPAQELARWNADLVNRPAPDGESLSQLDRRCGAFFEELARAEAETTLVVTHGGVIRVTLARWLGMPLANALRLVVDFGGVTKATLDRGRAAVQYVNR